MEGDKALREELEKRRTLFMKKVRKLDNGCWEWTAAKTPDGYGYFGMGKLAPGKKSKSKGAHVAAVFLFNDQTLDLDAGHSIDHRCHKPDCVNPAHLTVMTAYGNNLHKSTTVLGNLDKMEHEFPEAASHIQAVRRIVRAKLGK
jgi:hypothetical protein